MPRWLAAFAVAAPVVITPSRAPVRADPPPVAAPADAPADAPAAAEASAEAEATATAQSAEKQRAQLAALAERVRPSVVAIQVRGTDGSVVRRNAVVVDATGWLVLVGPVPGPRDTVVAVLPKGVATPVVNVASDPETAITLLQLLAPPPGLTAVALPTLEPKKPLPAPPVPGAGVVMVASDGALARGSLRAVDRARSLPNRLQGGRIAVGGLLEASLATIASDLGAPWFDGENRLVGLLVGGLLEEQPALAPGSPMRPEPVAAHAVPAAVVSLVWPLLRTERTVRRARLGVQAKAPSAALIEQLCPACGGLELQVVDPDGPAARAGLEVHDVIISVEGVKLRPHVSLSEALLPFRPLDPVTFGILRRGQRTEVRAILGGGR
jgi:S1-C subfamily serine protease